MMISFIIISGGSRPASIKRLLKSITNLNIKEHQVIIVGKYGGELADNITLISRPDLADNAAICEMRNIGISKTKGKTIILLDDDIEFSPGWYNDIKKRLTLPFDMLGCRVLLPTGERWYDWNWASRKDPFSPARLLDYGDKNNSAYISGCLMIIRKDVLNKIRFNEALLNHQHDDVDFCHRVTDSGFHIDIFPGAYVVHHLEPAGRSRNDPAAGSDNFSEGIYFFRLGHSRKALRLLLADTNPDSAVKTDYHAALCFAKLGETQKAKKKFNQVINDADITDMEEKRLYYSAYYHLGSLFEKETNLDEARSCYIRTLEGIAEHHEAAKAVARLSDKNKS